MPVIETQIQHREIVPFLCRYLEYFDLKEGNLLSYCFNKTKQSGLLPPVVLKGRTLIEAIVWHKHFMI